MNTLKTEKNILFRVLAVVLTVVAASALSIIFLIVRPLSRDLSEREAEIGQESGKLVGIAAAPFELPKDVAEGFAEGREEGESAEDTVAAAYRPIESLGAGVLDVFKGDVAIYNTQTMGESLATGAYYASLYMYKGQIIFSVDLNDAVIAYRGQDVCISIPEPSYRLTIDERNTEPVATYESFVGSVITTPKDGITSSLNSRAEILEKSAEQLAEFPELMDMAREEAVRQIKTMAQAVFTGRTVKVQIREE